MAWAKAPKRSLVFDPNWNLELLKKELLVHDRSLRKILKDHATETTGWRGLYNDVRRWREMDPDLQRLIDENVVAMDNRKGPAKGRKRADEDPGEGDWRLAYVTEYLATNSREKASLKTPYTAATLTKMMQQGRTEYDKQFAEMVEIAEQQLVNKASEVVFNALDEAVNQQATPKDKAYIALGILKTHSKGWQQKMELNVTGSVKFEIERGRVIGELIADQQRFFGEHRPKALLTDGNTIDAECVEVKE
jgi:hypothetical protein